jgi:hypothetical protein
MKAIAIYLIMSAQILVASAQVLATHKFWLPEIGSKLSKKDIPADPTELWMTHPVQMRPFITRTIDDVKYVIAYDEEMRRVRYITTSDSNFKTRNGLSIGQFVEVSPSQISAFPGWEVHAPLTKDGWIPVIGFLNRVTILSDGFEKTLDVKELGEERVKCKATAFMKGGN